MLRMLRFTSFKQSGLGGTGSKFSVSGFEGLGAQVSRGQCLVGSSWFQGLGCYYSSSCG